MMIEELSPEELLSITRNAISNRDDRESEIRKVLADNKRLQEELKRVCAQKEFLQAELQALVTNLDLSKIEARNLRSGLLRCRADLKRARAKPASPEPPAYYHWLGVSG